MHGVLEFVVLFWKLKLFRSASCLRLLSVMWQFKAVDNTQLPKRAFRLYGALVQKFQNHIIITKTTNSTVRFPYSWLRSLFAPISLQPTSARCYHSTTSQCSSFWLKVDGVNRWLNRNMAGIHSIINGITREDNKVKLTTTTITMMDSITTVSFRREITKKLVNKHSIRCRSSGIYLELTSVKCSRIWIWSARCLV